MRPFRYRRTAPPEDRNVVREVAFRKLFDEHWPRVRRHLACYIENEEIVDELTSEVFVIAWRKLHPTRPMGLVWLLRTADNKLRDHTRRTRSSERVLEALTRRLDDPSSAIDHLDAMALRHALGNLNARERQVVVLTYWDELSAIEVASVLKTSEGAVWTTLTRARRKLRDQLEAGPQ